MARHTPDRARRPRLAQRRALGAYYTPPELAAWLAGEVLAPCLQSPASGPRWLLDPACGDGALLAAAARRLPARERAADWTLCGVDISADAVALARKRLQGCGGAAVQIASADALAPGVWAEQFAAVQAAGGFDAIVGNPPFLSIRELARSQPKEALARYRRDFLTARGNFDIYVLFVELALRLLRPGGRCGLVLPNKWAGLDYARSCRELLLRESRLESVLDLSTSRPFSGAAVYPQVLIFEKRRQSPAAVADPPLRLFTCGKKVFATESLAVRTIEREQLEPTGFRLGGDWNIEQRLPCQPLGELAELHSGASGYSAARLLPELFEARNARRDGENKGLAPRAAAERDGVDFVVSGNIARYAIAPGDVQFLRQRFARPRLRLDSPALSPVKRRLYAAPKLVVSGMGRELHAAWDATGVALGVQTFALTQPQVDPFYLLALLNARAFTWLFQQRFAAKRLGGGYFAVNKGQLARLPVPLPEGRAKALCDQLANLSRQLSAANMTASQARALDAQLDHLTEQLLELSPAERAQLAADCSPRPARMTGASRRAA